VSASGSYSRVIVDRRGGPDVLRLHEEGIPEPAPGEARVKVQAAGVAFADVLMREGLYPGVKVPFTPGYDVAGTVDALGAEVTGHQVGDRVVGFLPFVVDGASAVAAYVVPSTGDALDLAGANVFTSLGALCFLIGAVLLLPQAANVSPASDDAAHRVRPDAEPNPMKETP